MKRRREWRVAEPPRAAAPSGSQLQRPAHLEPAQQLLAGRQVALAEGPLSQGRRGEGLLTIDGSAGPWLAGIAAHQVHRAPTCSCASPALAAERSAICSRPPCWSCGLLGDVGA